MRMNLVVGALGVIALSGTASAAFFVESEPNNSMATADNIGVYTAPGDAFLVDGGIRPNADEDWFVFSVTDASQIRLAVFGRPDSTVGDSYLELFDSNGVRVAFDDDSGVENFSALEYNTTGAGTYYVRLTSFDNASSFDYKLVGGINVVPAPASMALLGLAGLGLRRRR